MGHGNTADDAGKNAACCYQTDGKAIWAGEKAAVPQGCKSDYHCDRCWKRRRVGSTLDPGKIRMQKADQTSVDLLSHRQSHPRRICKPA